MMDAFDLTALVGASGLTPRDRETVEALVQVFERNQARNGMLADYYGGDIRLKNIGIAVPDTSYAIVAKDVKAHCDWPAIAVDRLAERSMFDGFFFDGGDSGEFGAIAASARIGSKYRRMLPLMLVHGCAFWTVGRASNGMPPAIRVHSAQSASAIWDGEHDRIGAGMAIVGTRYDARLMREVPTKVDVHTADAVIRLDSDGSGGWRATRMPHPMGRPMMEPFCYNANERWRFGQSRISRQVRAIADSMMRESFRCEVAAELNVLPQKYAAGLTTEQFNSLVGDKFKNAVGSMLLLTKEDPADPNPAVGQFPQVSLQSHIEMKRDLAADFSGITGIPMSQLGVTHDNPSSGEAIEAAERPLINIAERLNEEMADSLRNVALMAMAVNGEKPFADLSDEELGVSVHFRDPAMPSASATTDRAIKIVSAAPAYAETEQFWVDVGKDEAQRRQIMSDLRRAQARMGASAILDRNRQVMPDADEGGGAGALPGAAGRDGI